MTSPATSPGSAEKPTVYRGLGALIGGALVTLFCLGGAIDLIVEQGRSDLVGASILCLVAVLAFSYGVYPAAYAYDERLVVRNPIRTITLPWSAVTNLTAKLSFIVHTEQARYTVWSVPVSLRDRRRAERTRLRELARHERETARARKNAGSSAYGLDSGPSRRGGGYDTVDRLSFADQAVSEMNERIERSRDRSRHPAPGAEPAVIAQQSMTRANLATVIPLAAALVFLIVALIVH